MIASVSKIRVKIEVMEVEHAPITIWWNAEMLDEQEIEHIMAEIRDVLLHSRYYQPPLQPRQTT